MPKGVMTAPSLTQHGAVAAEPAVAATPARKKKVDAGFRLALGHDGMAPSCRSTGSLVSFFTGLVFAASFRRLAGGAYPQQVNAVHAMLYCTGDAGDAGGVDSRRLIMAGSASAEVPD